VWLGYYREDHPHASPCFFWVDYSWLIFKALGDLFITLVLALLLLPLSTLEYTDIYFYLAGDNVPGIESVYDGYDAYTTNVNVAIKLIAGLLVSGIVLVGYAFCWAHSECTPAIQDDKNQMDKSSLIRFIYTGDVVDVVNRLDPIRPSSERLFHACIF
jgi:hypothetical protein